MRATDATVSRTSSSGRLVSFSRSRVDGFGIDRQQPVLARKLHTMAGIEDHRHVGTCRVLAKILERAPHATQIAVGLDGDLEIEPLQRSFDCARVVHRVPQGAQYLSRRLRRPARIASRHGCRGEPGENDDQYDAKHAAFGRWRRPWPGVLGWRGPIWQACKSRPTSSNWFEKRHVLELSLGLALQLRLLGRRAVAPPIDIAAIAGPCGAASRCRTGCIRRLAHIVPGFRTPVRCGAGYGRAVLSMKPCWSPDAAEMSMASIR